MLLIFSGNHSQCSLEVVPLKSARNCGEQNKTKRKEIPQHSCFFNYKNLANHERLSPTNFGN